MAGHRTIWELLAQCVQQLDEPFRRSEIIGWFRRHHPEVNEPSLAAHIQGTTSNASADSQFAFAARPPLLTRIDHGLYIRYSGPPMQLRQVNPRASTVRDDVTEVPIAPGGQLVDPLVNDLTSPVGADDAEPSLATETTAAADSAAQRLAEGPMLSALGDELGVTLNPRRLYHHSGVRVEIDGADEDLSVLVECWAHQGPAKVAQKMKLINDAMKLQWVASWLTPRPTKLVLCVSDEAAIAHLRGKSWQAAAIRDAGVELHVVDLDPSIVASVVEAQTRQYR